MATSFTTTNPAEAAIAGVASYNPFGAANIYPAPNFVQPQTQPQTQPQAQTSPQADYQARANAVAYSALLDSINRQQAILNERQGQYTSSLDQTYNTQRGGLEAANATGNENLNRQRQTATRTKNISLRDLSNNIRNAYTSGIGKLGVQGAGNSSATKMYGYALGQEEGQNRSKLLDDYNYNQQGIDLAKTQLDRNFQQQIAALDDWKRSELFNIVDKFRVQRDALEEQKRSATASQAAAISQQQAALAQNAVNNVGYVQQAHQTNVDQLSQAAAADQRGYNQPATQAPGIDFRAANAIQSSLVSPFRRKDSQLPY